MSATDGAAAHLAVHDGEGAQPFRDRVLALWPLAFGPVADADDWRHRFWEQHRTRAEFRLVTAELGGELAGFAWGYTGQRGQWWADRVAGVLGDAADAWVGGHWEFVELAVHPEHRRRGLGGLLHDALLEGLPHGRALLQTDEAPDGAGHSLYRRRGWQVIGGLPEGKSVMGKHLPG
ncbi:GNAT family N-acetyltransferase [Brachybacterium sp. EE-P12]|uniref:GNAT family N-acetyltransferase n=1 Tax=Brachybacterium sp. EE-P12 TaxID=2306299 RepID=UPI000F0979AD|nr:GNAT family N-acetyltransferase [Brachybacterium sp. EE-P12]